MGSGVWLLSVLALLSLRLYTGVFANLTGEDRQLLKDEGLLKRQLQIDYRVYCGNGKEGVGPTCEAACGPSVGTCPSNDGRLYCFTREGANAEVCCDNGTGDMCHWTSYCINGLTFSNGHTYCCSNGNTLDECVKSNSEHHAWMSAQTFSYSWSTIRFRPTPVIYTTTTTPVTAQTISATSMSRSSPTPTSTGTQAVSPSQSSPIPSSTHSFITASNLSKSTHQSTLAHSDSLTNVPESNSSTQPNSTTSDLPTAVPESIPVQSAASAPSLAGPIAGGVVGGLAIIVGGIIAVLLILRRKRRDHHGITGRQELDSRGVLPVMLETKDNRHEIGGLEAVQAAERLEDSNNAAGKKYELE